MITLEKNCESLKDLVQFSTPENIREQLFGLDENYMIKLTKENAQKAHVCIRSDARYEKSSYEEYYKKLGKRLADYTSDEVEKIIGYISTSNSTRSPKESICALSQYIYANLNTFLKKLNDGDITVIEELENVKTPRYEKSLISKICRYLCELEFGEIKFIINDNVVRGILPYYLDFYGVDKRLWTKKGKIIKFDKLSYSQLHNLIEEVRKQAAENLTLRDVDDILWYCYKNDNVRTSIAQGIVLKEL